jgi:hypothetical protein
MGQLSESLAVITENLKAIFKNFTGKRIMVSIFSLMVLIFITLLAYDYFTGYLYFNRIGKKISILEKIEYKSDEGIFKDKIKESYFNILQETMSYDTKKSITIDKNSKNYKIIIKVLVSLVLPIIILFAVLGTPDAKNAFIGVLMFIFVFGFISAFIPIIYKLWLTCLIIIVLEIIGLTIITKVYNK